ncbi:MAG: cobalamin biosynthesis protein [Deltaproteobacteria bacterium]|nr:cobalamin biosynthesis protein [Deltaproteobacteria bacterium]MBZ0219593.1 cobalamin biosynthesis protein [Deltaproteobacteria bacterium]
MSGRADVRAGIAVFAVTRRGLQVSKRLESALKGVKVFSPEELKDGGLKRKAASAFKRYGALVFISATGIAVRAIAPLMKAKHLDPAVVVVDERARFSISLLSGHLGGANRLAAEIAAALKAAPVITTATELWGLPSAEDIAEAFSLSVENPGSIKAVNSSILDGRTVHIADSSSARLKALKARFGKGGFKFTKSAPRQLKEGEAVIHVTSGVQKNSGPETERTLVLRPREVVAGIGCGKGVPKEEIKKALRAALRKAGISPLSIRGLATIELKRGEKGITALAKEMRVSVEYFGSKRLARVRIPSPRSVFVKEIAGTWGVAEPAALISSGVRELCLRKIKRGRVTVALARAPFTS